MRTLADGFSEDGNGEIATIAPDGAACGAHPHGRLRDRPAWSPDRGRIVFSRIRRNDATDLYVMGADGQHVGS